MRTKKKVRAVAHQQVLSQLLKKPGFREGYEKEVHKLVDTGEPVIKIRQ